MSLQTARSEFVCVDEACRPFCHRGWVAPRLVMHPGTIQLMITALPLPVLRIDRIVCDQLAYNANSPQLGTHGLRITRDTIQFRVDFINLCHYSS